MSEKIVQLNEEVIKGQLKELVRGSVEETLNELLEQEAEKLTQAARYERNEARQGYRSGHYDRNLTTTSGDVTLHVPRLKGVSFETAIIERYRRRESSVSSTLSSTFLAASFSFISLNWATTALAFSRAAFLLSWAWIALSILATNFTLERGTTENTLR